MAKGGAAMIEIICNGDDEAKKKKKKKRKKTKKMKKIRQSEDQKTLSRLEMSVQTAKFI